MKRSEMLDKIDDLLISQGHHKGGSFDLTNIILDFIEEQGMKPPERVFWNRKDSGALMPHQKNGEMVNSWEPE